jgi:feruloyl esterase
MTNRTAVTTTGAAGAGAEGATAGMTATDAAAGGAGVGPASRLTAIMLILLALTPALASAATTGGGASACTALTSARTFKDTTITAARMIGADSNSKTPAYCEVTGVITPVPGSHITVVYRLPESWNGKLVGLGGGGWAGNLTLDRSGARTYAAATNLAQGYATAQTDGGHPSTEIWDTSWSANVESFKDFSYRAVHLMTTVGKSVVTRYYGKPQKRAYFQGCSTGGRQGLMEVQRFPDDYDGVISGAPVYNFLTQTSALVRNEALARPGAALTAGQVTRLHDAVLAACDAQDGLKDGIVTDPRACSFDPATLQCQAGAPTPDCLTAPEVAAIRSVYAGLKTSDGRTASYPLSRGGEAGWARFVVLTPVTGPDAGIGDIGNGLGGLRQALFGNPDYDLRAFDAERDLQKLRGSEFAGLYEAKDPNIAPFVAHGGKLLLWHGFDDPGPSALGTVEYYEAVRQTTGPKARTLDASLRLFLLSGVYHCRGGPGADGFDSLAALDRWVDSGQAPDDVIATREDGKLSRPLCRYPTLPHYKGDGDPAVASSFECR